MPQKPASNVPDGWEVVEQHNGVPEGWEVVDDKKPAPAAPSSFMSNLGNSLVKFGSDTASGIGSIVKGAVGAGMATFDPGMRATAGQTILDTVKSSPEIAQVMWKALTDRYGSLEKAKHTFYTDPVGAVADVSTALAAIGSGGALSEGAIARFAPGVATKVGEIAKIAETASKLTNPMSALTGVKTPATTPLIGERNIPGLVTPVAAGLKKAAPVVYEAALGRTGKMKEEFPGAATRGVEERVVPTKSGVKRALDKAEDKLMSEVNAHDAERPAVKALLPAGDETVSVPLGETPTPGEMPIRVSGAQPLPLRRPPVGASGQRFAEHIEGVDPVETLFSSTLDETGHRPPPLETPDFAGPGVLLKKRPVNAPLWQPGEGAPAGMVDPKTIADRARELTIKNGGVEDLGIRKEIMDKIQGLHGEYIAENQVPKTGAELLRQKRAEQRLASYKVRAEPEKPTEALWHKSTAAANREKLVEEVPGAEAGLNKEEDLLGLKDAVVNPHRSLASKIATGLMMGGIAPTAIFAHPSAAAAELVGMAAIHNPVMLGTAGIGLDMAGDALRNPMTKEAMDRAVMLRLLQNNNVFGQDQ